MAESLFVVRTVTAFALAVALSGSVVAQSPREALSAAKRLAYDANYRNDQKGLRDAIGRLEQLETDEQLAASALYFAGWTRWMLAASEIVASQPKLATVTLETAVGDLKRGLALQPDDAETHALLAWVLVAIASNDRSRWGEVSQEVAAHRTRALILAPKNPRVMIMDASMIFYAPPQAGGNQQRAIARWQEALKIFDAERIEDPVRPDWGGALAYGWLANLFLFMSPPNKLEARRLATKALEMQPDFWWVKTQVLPRTIER